MDDSKRVGEGRPLQRTRKVYLDWRRSSYRGSSVTLKCREEMTIQKEKDDLTTEPRSTVQIEIMDRVTVRVSRRNYLQTTYSFFFFTSDFFTNFVIIRLVVSI